jgi:hypothetical protein
LTGALTGAAVEAVAMLTADERRALAELMPTFPQELGGGATAFLTRGLAVRLEVGLPPKASVKLAFEQLHEGQTIISSGVIRLPPQTYAEELDAFILRLRDMVLASPALTAAINSAAYKPQAGPLMAAIKEVLTPVAGALNLDDAHIHLLSPMVVTEASRAWYASKRRITLADLRGITQAANVYSADNDERLPESLDVMVRNGQISPKQLVNPADPKHRPYVYRAIVPVNTTDAGLPLVWEQVDDDQPGLCVGYEDGHAEWTPREVFEDAVKRGEQERAKMDAEIRARTGAQQIP